jgi:hypothetical protein
MGEEASRLGQALLLGQHESALSASRRSPELARAVSLAVADQLVAGAMDRRDPHWPPHRTWDEDQDAVVALAKLPEADGLALAKALLRACDRQFPVDVSDQSNRLHEQTFRWLMEIAADEVEEVIKGLGDRRHGTSYIARWLHSLPGDEGARWLVRMIRADEGYANLMVPPRLEEGGTWSTEDWNARLNAMADARFDPRPRQFWIPREQYKPPAETSPAQVRLACTYAESREDYLLMSVAANLKAYRTGESSHDVELVWWSPANDRQRESLRWLLEQSGRVETVAPLVEAARAQGLLDENLADYLTDLDTRSWRERASLDPSRRIDLLVRDLFTDLDALGLSIPLPEREPSVLDEIDRTLAPVKLPRSVRRLWELVNPATLVLLTHPELATPEFGLRSWRMSQDAGAPAHFFQLCYSSHAVLSVECDGPDWTGGCLFDWFISDGSPFELRYRSVEDWLEVQVSALREGAFERGDAYARLDTDRLRELAARKLASYESHPDYGTQTVFPRDPPDQLPIWSSRGAQTGTGT